MVNQAAEAEKLDAESLSAFTTFLMQLSGYMSGNVGAEYAGKE
ncbi:MAG: hypothetical protein UX35_C0007G0030 [Microgenomates group bacterium GW2011_GWA1_46_15]|nr:MAG: hypothetical protein UX00_C0009G0042 [Microgenomates group bacterium GW2011_GWB1_45_17]KKU23292.1 MAG: hypothetical protein UX35_C0007G0030 [Microgenomates group bacterium GW2011_GWA1_46_15]KKU23461.1 MAG: hypothetical protein UX36_C0005G0042 [Microgenomates group bacterium GW2011_GWC1_46_15]